MRVYYSYAYSIHSITNTLVISTKLHIILFIICILCIRARSSSMHSARVWILISPSHTSDNMHTTSVEF